MSKSCEQSDIMGKWTVGIFTCTYGEVGCEGRAYRMKRQEHERGRVRIEHAIHDDYDMKVMRI